MIAKARETTENDRGRLQVVQEDSSRASSVEVPSPTIGVRRSSGFTAYTFEEIQKNAHESLLRGEDSPQLEAPEDDSHYPAVLSTERDPCQGTASVHGKLYHLLISDSLYQIGKELLSTKLLM